MSDSTNATTASNDEPTISYVTPHQMCAVLARRFAEDGDFGTTARIGVEPTTIEAAINAISGDHSAAPSAVIDALGLGNSSASWNEIHYAMRDRMKRIQQAQAIAEEAEIHASDFRNHPAFNGG